MGVVDIICLVILIIWLLLGLKRGFIFEILSLVVMALVFVIACLVSPMLGDIVGKIATPGAAMDAVVFVISFVIVLSIVQIFANKIINTLGTFDKIGTISRVLGGVTALFRGTVFVSLALWVLVSVMNPMSGLSQKINNGIVTSNTQMVAAFFYDGISSIVGDAETEANEQL